MRFDKARRYPFTWSQRKAAAVLVRQRKDREKLPLFGELIAETQRPVEEVREAREAAWIAREIERRETAARQWREVRARIAQLPDRERRLFLDMWNGHRWFPGNAGYAATVLAMYQRGYFVERNGKLIPKEEADWIDGLKAKVRAMDDEQLASTIQSHPNMVMVEAARDERRRRFEEGRAAA